MNNDDLGNGIKTLALVWEDATSRRWMSCNLTECLRRRHSIPLQLIANIAGLGGLLAAAVRSS